MFPLFPKSLRNQEPLRVSASFLGVPGDFGIEYTGTSVRQAETPPSQPATPTRARSSSAAAPICHSEQVRSGMNRTASVRAAETPTLPRRKRSPAREPAQRNTDQAEPTRQCIINVSDHSTSHESERHQSSIFQ